MLNESQNKFRLRVSYKKTGRLVWLSHLELIRAIEAMIRRTGLKYCVSQGFSPHMKISFGPALGVGIESNNLKFDIYLKEYVNPETALDLMQNNSALDLYVTDCEYVDNSEASLNSVFGKTEYSVILEAEIEKVLVPNKINVIKKKKEVVLNTQEYLCSEVLINKQDNRIKLNFCLETKPSGSLKPEVFLKAVLEHSGCLEYKILNFKKI